MRAQRVVALAIVLLVAVATHAAAAAPVSSYPYQPLSGFVEIIVTDLEGHPWTKELEVLEVRSALLPKACKPGEPEQVCEALVGGSFFELWASDPEFWDRVWIVFNPIWVNVYPGKTIEVVFMLGEKVKHPTPRPPTPTPAPRPPTPTPTPRPTPTG